MEALAIRTVGPDQLPIPKGSTVRQVKLAARMLTFDPAKDTLKQCLLDCGFALETAENQTSRVTGAVGVKRATEVLIKRQMDSARGLVGTGNAVLERGVEELDELRPVERLQFGLKCIELGASLGENLDTTGEAAAWKARERKAIRRGYRAGFATGLAHNVAGISEKTRQLLTRLGLLPVDAS